MSLDIRRIGTESDMLGESPLWDVQNGWLYWVDSFSRKIHRLDPSTGARRHWNTPSMVGSIGLGPEGSLIAGLVDGLYRLSLADGEPTPLMMLDPPDPHVRFNDGKMDRDGRFLCGSMGIHADPRGTLWRLDAQGRCDALAQGIRIANSLCFSPDGATLYFADSLDRAIRAYPYGPDGVGHQRILVDTAQWNSGPDGATVDADGCIWVCLVQVGKIACISPEGELVRMIEAPVDLPSSLAFGGDELSTLFLTSIKDSGSGRAISKHPDGGMLFAIDGLGAKGLPEARFGQGLTTHGS